MKNSILILGILIVLALSVCAVLGLYVEPAIGLMVGFIFGFVTVFHWRKTEVNRYEPAFRICNFLFFGLELAFFAILISGILFHYQIGILVGVAGILLGILFSSLYQRFSKKIIS
jgi:hypothetical protein